MYYINAWQLYLLIWCFVRLVETHQQPQQYKTLRLEDDKVCSEVTTRSIKFDTATALNLTTTRYTDHYNSWTANLNCHFRVKPSSRYTGIVVVIQQLSFRRNAFGDCLDYVQFKTDVGRTSDKICGTIDARSVMNSLFQSDNEDEVETNTFVSSRGHLDVYIFIAREELEYEEETNIEIVFTLYKDCGVSGDSFKPCIENENICINKHYFNDGIVNCPYVDCVDEDGCAEIIVYNSVGNKVLIGSVTSLVLIFVIFILCLYICRKQGKLCWADGFSNPNVTPVQRPRVIEMNESPNQSETVNPSAPTLDSQDQEDKDLPPSYDSLFPATR